MAIDLVKESIECEQLLGENTADTVIKGEYVIPDTHPDVYQILTLDAKPSIVTKEVMQDKIYLEGQIQYNVLYLAKEDENRSGVHNVSYTSKFSNSIELDGANRAMPCEAECYIEHMEPVIINERKIAVEGIIKLKSSVYKNYNFEIVKDLRGLTDVQVLKDTASVDKIVGSVEGEMVAKSHLQIPMDKPQIGTVLKCDVNLHKKETKLLEGKVNLSAFARFEILYRGKDSEDIFSIQDDVLASKEVELEAINSFMQSFTDFNVDDMIYDIKEDDLGEKRIVDIEALIKTNTKVMSKEHMDTIEDVYSPSMVMNMEKKNYDLNVMHGHASNEAIVKGNIEIPEDFPKPASIVLTTGNVCVTDKKLVEDKVIVEGLLNVEVLYRTNEEEKAVFVIKDEIPFTTSVEVPGTKIDMQCMANAGLENIESQIEANTIGVKAIVSVYGRVNYLANKEFLVNVIPNEAEKPMKKASITIYVIQNGDNLWKIAKKYNTTVDALIQINELENLDSLKIGMKLIIPGRAII
jgi:LysM repeat protein